MRNFLPLKPGQDLTGVYLPGVLFLHRYHGNTVTVHVCVAEDVILPVTRVAHSSIPSCWLLGDQTDTSAAS